MARGPSNWAAVAGPPSPEKPATPVPATVVIVPVGSIRRMRSLPESAMYSSPDGAAYTAFGSWSWAAVAGPPSPPAPGVPLPATVVMIPEARSTRRTR
jgi:hypothetical protein